ncbi:hypothetical protein OIU92_30960 [Escherichia coli]|nr:hypothetical protein [Escherichia coli]MCW0137705.1 hypothetical protein [Escherichia coli]
MRNGKILGWAWGAGFVDGIGQEWSAPPSRLSGWVPQPLTGLVMSLKMGIGGGASKAAQTLSDYYIKRAEQYHPVIPIGAGNESDRGVPGRLPAENRGRDGAGTHAEQSGRRESGKSGSCSAIG